MKKSLDDCLKIILKEDYLKDLDLFDNKQYVKGVDKLLTETKFELFNIEKADKKKKKEKRNRLLGKIFKPVIGIAAAAGLAVGAWSLARPPSEVENYVKGHEAIEQHDYSYAEDAPFNLEDVILDGMPLNQSNENEINFSESLIDLSLLLDQQSKLKPQKLEILFKYNDKTMVIGYEATRTYTKRIDLTERNGSITKNFFTPSFLERTEGDLIIRVSDFDGINFEGVYPATFLPKKKTTNYNDSIECFYKTFSLQDLRLNSEDEVLAPGDSVIIDPWFLVNKDSSCYNGTNDLSVVIISENGTKVEAPIREAYSEVTRRVSWNGNQFDVVEVGPEYLPKPEDGNLVRFYLVNPLSLVVNDMVGSDNKFEFDVYMKEESYTKEDGDKLWIASKSLDINPDFEIEPIRGGVLIETLDISNINFDDQDKKSWEEKFVAADHVLCQFQNEGKKAFIVKPGENYDLEFICENGSYSTDLPRNVQIRMYLPELGIFSETVHVSKIENSETLTSGGTNVVIPLTIPSDVPDGTYLYQVESFVNNKFGSFGSPGHGFIDVRRDNILTASSLNDFVLKVLEDPTKLRCIYDPNKDDFSYVSGRTLGSKSSYSCIEFFNNLTEQHPEIELDYLRQIINDSGSNSTFDENVHLIISDCRDNHYFHSHLAKHYRVMEGYAKPIEGTGVFPIDTGVIQYIDSGNEHFLFMCGDMEEYNLVRTYWDTIEDDQNSYLVLIEDGDMKIGSKKKDNDE